MRSRRDARTGERGESGSSGAPDRHWYGWLTVISLGGLLVNVTYVLVSKRHSLPAGDAFYYHYQANLIVQGKGWFIDPAVYLLKHHPIVPAAEHAPLWTVALALADALGLRSYLAQLLWACLVGAGAVAVTGLAAREVAGRRAGLIAAALAAAYPNYWLNTGTGLSETLVLLTVGAVVLLCYQLWKRPSVSKAAALGIACAFAALTRSELILFVALVLVPTMLALRSITLRRRLALMGVGVLAALVIMAPWVGFNLARFSHPEFLSTELGSALVTANCRPTYYGTKLGYWSLSCLSADPASGDQSARDLQHRHFALEYVKAHESRLPVVLVARVGREFGLYAPLQQIRFDNHIEGRALVPIEIGLVMYYVMAITSVFGIFTLKRRGISVAPFIGILIEVVLTAVLLYGTTRFRTPLEVGLVVLTAVVVDDHLSHPRRNKDTEHLAPVVDG